MITIARYDFVTDAHIALGRLQAEGIEAQLADQHLVQTDWLYSIAVGGIRLLVPEEDEIRARHLLDYDWSQELDDESVEG